MPLCTSGRVAIFQVGSPGPEPGLVMFCALSAGIHAVDCAEARAVANTNKADKYSFFMSWWFSNKQVRCFSLMDACLHPPPDIRPIVWTHFFQALSRQTASIPRTSPGRHARAAHWPPPSLAHEATRQGGLCGMECARGCVHTIGHTSGQALR